MYNPFSSKKVQTKEKPALQSLQQEYVEIDDKKLKKITPDSVCIQNKFMVSMKDSQQNNGDSLWKRKKVEKQILGVLQIDEIKTNILKYNSTSYPLTINLCCDKIDGISFNSGFNNVIGVASSRVLKIQKQGEIETYWIQYYSNQQQSWNINNLNELQVYLTVNTDSTALKGPLDIQIFVTGKYISLCDSL